MAKSLIYQLMVRHWGGQSYEPASLAIEKRRPIGSFEAIDDIAISYLKSLSIDTVWLTGVICHATRSQCSIGDETIGGDVVVKGDAGSPYAITDYYAIHPFLSHDESQAEAQFDALVSRLKAAGLKVIIDFVPNHVSRHYHGINTPPGERRLGQGDDVSIEFRPNNHFYYLPGTSYVNPSHLARPFHEMPAKVTGNDCYTPQPSEFDWYETVKLNYGVDLHGTSFFDPVPDLWNRMRAILSFWLKRGVDGFRCDMVEMIPTPFWAWVISDIRRDFPQSLFIGEAYHIGNYDGLLGAGFDKLYDKANCYNRLEGLLKGETSHDVVHSVFESGRRYEGKMLRFWENHDEIRVASEHFASDAPLGMVMTALVHLTGKDHLMIYNGQELGEEARGASGYSGDDGKTSIFDYVAVPSIQSLVSLNFQIGQLEVSHFVLLSAYQSMLAFAQTNELIAAGGYYGLNWAQRPKSDLERLYLFTCLRHLNGKVFLLAFNLQSDHLIKTDITIPNHAIEEVKLRQDRLSIALHKNWQPKKNHDVFYSFSSTYERTELYVEIPACSALVFELKEN